MSDAGANESRGDEVAGSESGARSEPWAPSDAGARQGRRRGAAGPGSGALDKFPSERSGTVSDAGSRAPVDPAPTRSRVTAALIDLVPVLVLVVAALVVWTVTNWPWWAPLVPVAAVLIWCGLLWWGAATDGRTIGKRLLGLAEVVESTGGVPGPWSALGRLALRGGLSLVTLGIADLSYRWDPAGRQRTWWDRVVGTAVIPGAPDGRSDEESISRWAPADTPPPPVRGAGGLAARAGAAHARGGWVPVVGSAAHARSESVPTASPAVSGTASPRSPSPPAVSRTASPRTPSAPLSESRPSSPAPSPPPPATQQGDGADFLAPPLIGGEFRAVPRGASGPASGVRSGRHAAGDEPGLITGIGSAPTGSESSPAAADPQSTVRVPSTHAELIWDTGRHVTVTGRVLIGRDPRPADEEHADQLLPVTTDSVGVSKTHLQMDVGADGISVTDRQSTNGVRIVGADGRVRHCPPGEPVPVGVGDVVHFGGRTITING